MMDNLDGRAREVSLESLPPKQRTIAVLVPVWQMVKADDTEAWAGAVSQMKSGAHGAGGSGYWLHTKPKGLEYRVGYEPDVEEGFIPWGEVRKIILSAPAARFERLKAARAALLESQRTFPVWAASPAAAGCGMPHSWDDDPEKWTDAQKAYAAEREVYETERLRPWEEQRRIVDAEIRTATRTLWEPVKTVTIGGVTMTLGL
jgi:hypothetical protein